MRILVIMLYWYPYEGPLQPIYGAIFKDLIVKGHKITIVTSFPHFRKGRSETWDEYRGKPFEVSKWEGAKLVRSFIYAPVFNSEKSGLIYRGLNFLSFNISSIFAAVFFGGKADVVFAPSSPPLTNGICAWIVSLWKRCPVVYNIQDMYPDMAKKTGLLKNRFILIFLKNLEKIVYWVSIRIMVISEDMRKNIQQKGVPIEKIVTISNFIDTGFIEPASQDNPFSRQWDLTRQFVIMYAGNIGIPHGLEVVVEAAAQLLDEKEIKFCFVGRGEYKEKIENMAVNRKLKNVIFVPPQPEKAVPNIWATASISLVTYRRGLSDDSVPSKLFAIMCSSRPVIAAVDKDTETYRIIKKARCGICVEPEDATALSKAIKHLCRDEGERNRMGKNGRKYVVKHFQKDVIVDQYENVFLEINKPLKFHNQRVLL